MKNNTYQLMRCGLILDLLGKKAGCTKVELIRHLEIKGLPRVSMRTLERDLDVLRVRFNARIRYDHRSRWYVLDSQHEQTRDQLSALIALAAMADDLQGVIDILDHAGDMLLMRTPSSYTSPRFLFSVARSLKKGFVLRIEYNFIETRGIERLLVEPHLLLFEPGNWQLIAWIETEKHFVNLQLNRILYLEETQIKYRRQNIDPIINLHLKQNIESNSGPVIRFRSSEPLYYRLVLKPPYPRFRIERVEAGQNPVWEMQVPSESAAEQLVRTYLNELELIEPDFLREKLRQRMANLLVGWGFEIPAG
jgi:predicted DNA-binding transcriptional regulator YafY